MPYHNFPEQEKQKRRTQARLEMGARPNINDDDIDFALSMLEETSPMIIETSKPTPLLEPQSELANEPFKSNFSYQPFNPPKASLDQQINSFLNSPDPTIEHLEQKYKAPDDYSPGPYGQMAIDYYKKLTPQRSLREQRKNKAFPGIAYTDLKMLKDAVSSVEKDAANGLPVEGQRDNLPSLWPKCP